MKKSVLGVFGTIAVCTALFVSCKEENPIVQPGKQLPIKIAVDIATKVTDTAFENGDAVGLYVVSYNGSTPGSLAKAGNHVDNMLMTFNGIEWQMASPAYWPDETTKADFYCYYPYRSVVDNIASNNISVSTDQTSIDSYKASDATWGKADGVSPTAENVIVTTKHMMSRVVVVLKAGTGWTDSDIAGATVTLIGLKSNGVFDMSTGIVTPAGAAGSIKPYKTADATYTALVVPQSVNSTELVQIKIGGNTYSYTTSMEFRPATKHTCTLVINRVGEGVNVGIGDWDVDDTDFGGTI